MAWRDQIALNEFFSQKHFFIPISPFHSAKFWKILRGNPELWGCAIFGPKIAQFVLNNFFFLVQTIFSITFIYILAVFIVQNLKRITANPVTRMCQFWTQNGLFAPNIFFSRNWLTWFPSTYLPFSHCKI